MQQINFLVNPHKPVEKLFINPVLSQEISKNQIDTVGQKILRIKDK